MLVTFILLLELIEKILILITKNNMTMSIIGTVKDDKSNEIYHVKWNRNERIVYLSHNNTGPWIEIEHDVLFESVALVFAKNYVDIKSKSPNYKYNTAHR